MTKITKVRKIWVAWNTRKLEAKEALLKIGDVLTRSQQKRRGRPPTKKIEIPDVPETPIDTAIINPDFTEQNGKFKCNFCPKEFDSFEDVQKHLNYYKRVPNKQSKKEPSFGEK